MKYEIAPFLLVDVTFHREIVFFSDCVDEVNKKETELIRKYDSNNPHIGYSR